eukprot:548241-Prorocentrum_minimum.AAC.1
MDQSDARSIGILSRWTNPTPSAWKRGELWRAGSCKKRSVPGPGAHLETGEDGDSHGQCGPLLQRGHPRQLVQHLPLDHRDWRLVKDSAGSESCLRGGQIRTYEGVGVVPTRGSESCLRGGQIRAYEGVGVVPTRGSESRLRGGQICTYEGVRVVPTRGSDSYLQGSQKMAWHRALMPKGGDWSDRQGGAKSRLGSSEPWLGGSEPWQGDAESRRRRRQQRQTHALSARWSLRRTLRWAKEPQPRGRGSPARRAPSNSAGGL